MGPESDPRERLPIFRQLRQAQAREEILRPKRVAAARQWQPLLQALHESGIAVLMKEKTGARIPELRIINKPYLEGVGIAEAVPQEDDVDLFHVYSRADSNLDRSSWGLAIVVAPQEGDEFDPTLRMEAQRMRPEFLDRVLLEVDQDRNLRIVGDREYFNGSIDHLNKKGQARIGAALNRAFRHPLTTHSGIVFATLGAA